MKKLLIGAFNLLLLILVISTIFNGIHIGGLQIFSLKQIQTQNEELNSNIEENNKLAQIDYVTKVEDFETAVEELEKAKENYEALLEVSSSGELQNVGREEVYTSEYLWIKLGNYATKEGLTPNFEIVESAAQTPGKKDIKFTVTGSYKGVTNYLYDIQNDREMEFYIESFELIPIEAGNNLQATFVVKDVSVTSN